MSKRPPDADADRSVRDEDLVLSGCHDESYNGLYWVDSGANAKVNSRTHYTNATDRHIYFARDEKDRARWVINDSLQSKSIEDALAVLDALGALPAGSRKWSYTIDSRQRLRDLDIMGVGAELQKLVAEVDGSPKKAGKTKARPAVVVRVPDDTPPGKVEIEDYAKYLQLDADEAQRLGFLVEEALCAPLTLGWSEFYQARVSCVFFNNAKTGNSWWHHPLELHYSSLIKRLFATLVAKAAADDGTAKAMWAARYDFVLADHYKKMKKILQTETQDQKEIRRLRYAKMFRKHANKRADDQNMNKQLMSKKIIDMLGGGAKKQPVEEGWPVGEPEAEPAPSPKSKWGKGMLKLKKDTGFIQAVAVAEAETKKEEEEEEEERKVKAPGDAAPVKKSKLIKAVSRPHDFNSTQLAQWRLMGERSRKGMHEDGLMHETEVLIGSVLRTTQGKLLMSLAHEDEDERPTAGITVQRFARGWLARKQIAEKIAARLAHVEVLIKTMLLRMQNKMLYTFWLSWCSFLEAGHRRRLAMKMLLRIRNKALFHCLEAFKMRVSSARLEREKFELARDLVRRMLFALQYKCLNAWHDNLAAARRKKLAIRMALRLQNAELYKCFAGLHVRVMEAHKMREKMALAKVMVRKLQNAQAHKCWLQWLDFHDLVRKKLMAQQMMRRLKNQQLYKCFSGFIGNIEDARIKREREVIARNMVRRMANAGVAKCWSTWLDHHDQIARKVLAVKMLKRLQNQFAFSVWTQWVANVDRAKRKKQAVSFLKRMQHQTACRCLLNWHSWTAQCKTLAGQEDSAAKMLKRLLNQQLFEAISQWHFYVTDTRTKRELAAKMVRRLLNKVLFASYSSWSEWAVDTREKRNAAKAMLLRLMNKVLCKNDLQSKTRSRDFLMFPWLFERAV